MKKIFASHIFVFVLFISGTAAFAQVPEHSADAHFERAQAAYQGAQYDAAMLELEQAWRKEERPIFLYWRVLTLQAMGEHALALNLIDENRSLLLAEPQVQDLHLVEERSRAALSVNLPEDPPPPVVERSTVDTVGPIVLGIVGLGLVAGSIPFWQEECTVPRGDRCLETSEPEYLIAGLLAGAGGAAMGGAVVWWVLGAPESPAQTAVILAPGAIVGRF